MFPILTDEFFATLESEFNDFFGNLNDNKSCSCGGNCKCKDKTPNLDVVKVGTETPSLFEPTTSNGWSENENTYSLSFALPCNKENIGIDVIDKKTVVINYEQETVLETKYSRESYSCRGTMRYDLPSNCDENTLTAKYEDNFLVLTVDKSLPKGNVSSTRQIEIK